MVSLSGCLGDPLEGEAAPPFELTTLDNRTVNLTTYEDRYLVLDFMATWCTPCKLQVQHLQDVQDAYGDRVAILSIGADPTESEDDLRNWQEEHDADWDHALDTADVRKDYGMRIIPKLVVIAPDGHVTLARSGEVYPAALASALGDTPAADPAPWRVPLLAAAGLLLGVLAPLNPYLKQRRAAWRAHAAATAPVGALVTAAALLLLAAGAYALRGPVAGRATYGGLLVGALALGGVLYAPLWRQRDREPDWPRDPATRPGAARAGLEFTYQALPHFAAALVLGLRAPSVPGLLAPVVACALGAGAAVLLLARTGGARTRGLEAAGAVGLAAAGAVLVGLGLSGFF